MGKTDQHDISLCLDGHPEAFRQLVTRYQAVLLAHLAGRLGDRERAEEASQETFVRAYFGLGKLKNPGSFYSWLLGIGDRVAKEQIRQQDREQRLVSLCPRRSPDPTQEPELSNDLALERAIGELPEIYREVILLRYYGHRSCAQVADQLGMPLGTVTKRLSRAYRMLRESIPRYEGSEADRKEPSEV